MSEADLVAVRVKVLQMDRAHDRGEITELLGLGRELADEVERERSGSASLRACYLGAEEEVKRLREALRTPVARVILDGIPQRQLQILNVTPDQDGLVIFCAALHTDDSSEPRREPAAGRREGMSEADLVAGARAHKEGKNRLVGKCRFCLAKWPCLPIRLADEEK